MQVQSPQPSFICTNSQDNNELTRICQELANREVLFLKIKVEYFNHSQKTKDDRRYNSTKYQEPKN